MAASALAGRGLRVVVTGTGDPIVRGADLVIRPGEVVGLVGESGAGKTALALGLLGYARPGSHIANGVVEFDGLDLLRLSAGALQDVLGRRIAFVPQNPGAALNPSMSVAAHLAEVLRLHARDVADPAARIGELLTSVALPDDDGFRGRFPHQLSGGQQQRVAIALAVACRPEVVVLDEPTTALDVTTQAQILRLIDELRERLGTAMLYVSHNLAVVAGIADRVAVMYGGDVVEVGPREEVFGRPRHPYTRMLLEAIPTLDGERRALVGIPGSAPGPSDSGPGCTFQTRCPHAVDGRCDRPQALDAVAPDHAVRCTRWRELLRSSRAPGAVREAPPPQRDVLLDVRGLSAHYGGRRGAPSPVVDDVSFEVLRGECLALVGESGSGKSTISRCIAGLHGDWSGTVTFDGSPLARTAQRRSRELRRRIQIVFQNPDRSLNPQQTVATAIGRPCQLLRGLGPAAARARVMELLELVRLSPRYADAYPAELSGGQRQRVAIARALAADGDLIVCDEVTSALDVSVQASLLELLYSLRRELALSLLFVSHDLSVVRSVADRILVLQDGVLRESSDVEALFASPRHAYTEALLHAAPRLRADWLEG